MKKLITCWGLLISFCLPAVSERPGVVRDRLEVAGTLLSVAVIPTGANSPGRFGAHYKTRVVIFNPTSRDYSITALLYGTNGPVSRNEIPIESGEYVTWDNFYGEVFDYSGGGAVLLVAPDEEDKFYMTAEVYTDSPNGRFSTTVVNGIIPLFVESNDPEYNVGISVNQNRRTNIGVWNWEKKPSSLSDLDRRGSS